MFASLLGDRGPRALDPAPRRRRRHRRPAVPRRHLRARRPSGPPRDGVVEVTDLMPFGDHRADVVRRVRGLRGTVELPADLRIRFGYSRALPWIRQIGDDDGPALARDRGSRRGHRPRAPAPRRRPPAHRRHDVPDGDVLDTVLTWYPSHREPPAPLDVDAALARHRLVVAGRGPPLRAPTGRYADAARRSLLLLRAMTHEDTGGIVAAATTSLPEQFGGERNWDYRYVWLRDASMTLAVAHRRTATATRPTHWRGWLLRAIAGDPADVQIMYGLAGERELPETRARRPARLPGATPVRVGNGASTQYQGDVFGEVMVALHDARELGVEENADSWALQRALLGYVEENWQEPDNGIWEIRGPRQHFTHSRVMIWAALDRAVAAVEQFGLEGPVDRWRTLRDEVRAEIEEHGWNAERGSLPPALRHRRGRRVPAAAAAGRVRRRRRPPDARHRPRHRGRPASATTASCSATAPSRLRRAGRRREPVPDLLVLARRAVRRLGTGRRRRAPDGRARRLRATTSACSPRRSRSPPDATSATPRRRCRTSRSSARRTPSTGTGRVDRAPHAVARARRLARARGPARASAPAGPPDAVA